MLRGELWKQVERWRKSVVWGGGRGCMGGPTGGRVRWNEWKNAGDGMAGDDWRAVGGVNCGGWV